ncbi:MAG TPA: nucleoside hydrolase, partial [Galbitalea sp.]
EVFAAGWSVVMVGLDLTLQAVVHDGIVERMHGLGELGTRLVAPLATFWTNPLDDDWDGQALHDVCAVAYLARPDLFQSKAAHVDVESAGDFTRGMTVVDFHSPAPNAIVPTKLDVEGFWDYVHEAWARVTPRG